MATAGGDLWALEGDEGNPKGKPERETKKGTREGKGDSSSGSLFDLLDQSLPADWRGWPESRKRAARIDASAPVLVRVGHWLGRKPTARWSVFEVEALAAIDPPEDELGELEPYYLAEIREGDFRRRSLEALLANWNTELDRARAWSTEKKRPKIDVGRRKPELLDIEEAKELLGKRAMCSENE